MTNEQRNKIAALVAEFFEKSEDLIAVTGGIESLIERRQELRQKQDEQQRERAA